MSIFKRGNITPVPVNPDAVRGLKTTLVCRDIIHPGLMDVANVETYTYELYQAPVAGVNNPEPGYAAHYREGRSFYDNPAATYAGHLAVG